MPSEKGRDRICRTWIHFQDLKRLNICGYGRSFPLLLHVCKQTRIELVAKQGRQCLHHEFHCLRKVCWICGQVLSVALALCAMSFGRPRWSDLFDSSSEDDGPATRRNVFPFYVFLTSFLRGLFNPEVDRNSLAVLQQRLQRDPRVRGLPPWMHDLIFHFAFLPFEIRTQVRGFMSLCSCPDRAATWRCGAGKLGCGCNVGMIHQLIAQGLILQSTSWKFEGGFFELKHCAATGAAEIFS